MTVKTQCSEARRVFKREGGIRNRVLEVVRVKKPHFLNVVIQRAAFSARARRLAGLSRDPESGARIERDRMQWTLERSRACESDAAVGIIRWQSMRSAAVRKKKGSVPDGM
jgi:hypothetical protein